MLLRYVESKEPVQIGDIVWINKFKCRVTGWIQPQLKTSDPNDTTNVTVERVARLTHVIRTVYAKTIKAEWVP